MVVLWSLHPELTLENSLSAPVTNSTKSCAGCRPGHTLLKPTGTYRCTPDVIMTVTSISKKKTDYRIYVLCASGRMWHCYYASLRHRACGNTYVIRGSLEQVPRTEIDIVELAAAQRRQRPWKLTCMSIAYGAPPLQLDVCSAFDIVVRTCTAEGATLHRCDDGRYLPEVRKRWFLSALVLEKCGLAGAVKLCS